MRKTALFFGSLMACPAFAHFADFKSPGPGMHFTVGHPVVVFADLFDDFNLHGVIVCPTGQTLLDNNGVAGPAHCSGSGAPVGWPQLQVLVDGVLQTDAATHKTTVPGSTDLDSNGNPDPINFNRFVLGGLGVGAHQVKVRGLFAPAPASDGATLDSPPITITVDPLPSGKTTLSLSADVSGALNWNNLIVVGNGHKVHANGAVAITNSFVTGLGTATSEGINGTASALDVENSVFEATGAVNLALTGGATVSNNEFRANNLLTFDSSDPDAAPILTLSGKTAAAKIFQANRIGAGRLIFDNTSHWLIGGDGDDATNILIGPRATINLTGGTSNVTVRGNYDHHNYRGGWSQGYNLVFSQAGSGILVEHNLFRASSWPIQNVTGEFRYNLVYGYGHTWLRSGDDGALIHHNVFAPEEGGGELDQGIWFYSGESGIQIYNNTFDGGGNAVSNNDAGGDFPFAGPVVQVSNDSHVASLRNNLMTYTRNFENSNGTAHVIGDAGTFGTVDYNAFYSPDNGTRDNYDISGMSEGVTAGFALHDVSGGGTLGAKDGQLALSPFAAARIYPFDSVVDEAAVWNRTQKLSTILAAFRTRYTPAPGSPVIDAGDPTDNDAHGRRADIGAIDAAGHDLDQFGKFPLDLIFRNGFEGK
ncbi:MAG TPA: hypothetical protein VF132_12825 [Rudaea sp.]